MPHWRSRGVGPAVELSPILQSLAPIRSHLTVISGLDHRQADSQGDGAGDHARAATVWLTGAHGKRTEGADVRAGISLDQIAAAELGKETALSSLELALERNEESAGSCDAGYSCLYQNTFCWRSTTAPLPMEIH